MGKGLAPGPRIKKKNRSKGKGPATTTKTKKPLTERQLKDLGIPKLNGITPAGIVKPKGKKKGKTFIEDTSSLLSILADVNDKSDTTIRSKLQRARDLEVIRQAKRAEHAKKEAEKTKKLEDAKGKIKRGKREKKEAGRELRRGKEGEGKEMEKEGGGEEKKKKGVRFA
ncbi:60S ribosomal subunit assembly/export protein [Saitoella coloradoensis]